MSDTHSIDRFQVRFGQHAIADYAGDHTSALSYADAMRQRFPRLLISAERLRRKHTTR